MRIPSQSVGVMRTMSTRSPRVSIMPAQMILRSIPSVGRSILPRFGGVGGVGGVALGFSCSRLACSCSGDDDCNDMFSSGVCGDIASCDETGGGVRCGCLRF